MIELGLPLIRTALCFAVRRAEAAPEPGRGMTLAHRRAALHLLCWAWRRLLALPQAVRDIRVASPLLAATAAMAIGAIAVGWVAGGYQAKALDQHMRAALIQRAERIAGGVNPGFVGRLTFTSADRGTPADEFVRTSLKSSAHMGDVRGVFSVQRRGGRYFFGPETYPAGDPMASAPGDEYRRPPLHWYRSSPVAGHG